MEDDAVLLNEVRRGERKDDFEDAEVQSVAGLQNEVCPFIIERRLCQIFWMRGLRRRHDRGITRGCCDDE
jgi:hypothetical protein